MTINDDDGRLKFEILSGGDTLHITVDVFEAYDALIEAEKAIAGLARELWFTAVKEWAGKALGLPDVTTKTAFTVRQTILARVKAVGKADSGTPS